MYLSASRRQSERGSGDLGGTEMCEAEAPPWAEMAELLAAPPEEEGGRRDVDSVATAEGW